VGRTLAGRYRILRPLGHGGMGVVYEAEALSGPDRFAIKILDREWTRDPAVISRFAREGRAATAAASDHIVRVLDGGTESGCPFLVMELLQGEDLGKRLRRLRTLPIGDAVHILKQVLRGLSAAHRHGVVHRDLKPDNVLLVRGANSGSAGNGGDGSDASFAKIVDFGMSKIERPAGGTAPVVVTRRGVVLGTPLYMSPEQARAAPDLDARSDLYSAGAMFFECLTGRPPHVGPTYEQILIAICTVDPPDVRRYRPEVSRELAAFVGKALAREPDARFQTADAMLDALAAITAGASLRSADPQVLRRRARARMIVAGVVAMVVGALVTLLAVALVGK
jgi:serine/threonine-protein kinase